MYQLVKAGEKGSGTSFDAAVNRGGRRAACRDHRDTGKDDGDGQVHRRGGALCYGGRDDGRVVTRKIENKKNLENLKPGDKIDITFTRALVTSVSPAN